MSVGHLRRVTGSLFVAIGLAACGGVEDEDDPLHADLEDWVEGADEAHLYQGLAAAGSWALPARTRRIGNEQRVAYDSAGPWNGGAGCASGITAGATMLRDHLIRYFPQISRIGGYNCRSVAGTNTLSQHGTGRALDVFIPTISGSADNTAGDAIANWLVENAQAMGVQSVIWDRTIWRVDHSPRDYHYTGVHPHHDHIHVEITEEASRKNAPWYRNPFGPHLCEEVPPETTVLSETGACFVAKGPDGGWRTADDGRGGELLWTRAVSGDKATSWAQWTTSMKRRGEYRVEVYVDPDFGRFARTRYQVRAGGLSYFPILDQSAASGWTSLGNFLFEPGDGQFVRIFDNSPEPLDGALRIVADAIRVVPLEVDGCRALREQGGVIRETSPCFHREGPNKGWKTASGAGHGGSLIFTKAKEGTSATNWAMWRVLVPAGRYDVSVFVDPAWGRFEATRFKIHASGETHPVRLDQSAANGWTSLGIFDFSGGTSQYVRVSDTSSDPVENGERRIAVDAVRVRPVP